MFGWWRKRQREKLLQEPFPESCRAIIFQNVGAARLLNREEQEKLENLVQVFVAEKNWEGCGGLELTEEIRITIAANACVLLLGLDHDLYSGVESILVYPSSVRRPQRESSFFDTSVQVSASNPAVLGEAHLGGPIILAWDAVAYGSRHGSLGQNVVFHEFAHKLDMLDHAVDGTPPLSTRGQYERWSKACGAVYFSMKRQLEAGEATFLDPYGAQSEAEFFAVATEFFFEKPRQLQRNHPQLYAVLAEFYRQDPAARGAPQSL